MIAVLTRTPVQRVHCTVDDWDFDPRYTDGACPICGWRPEPRAVKEIPEWLRAVGRVPWDLVALGLLFIVLVAVGIYVAEAAKLNLLPS